MPILNRAQTYPTCLRMPCCLAKTVASPVELKNLLKEKFMAVLMDIDSVAVDNRVIRELAADCPATPFLCISRERVHPELKDAISNHIYACLNKPVDQDELRYWMKCIKEDSPPNQ